MSFAYKVSVVIPTYNRAHSIKRAIESILSQTFTDYEIIIIDDGSTDNTEKVLTPFLERPNLKYIFQENKKQAAARNNGIRHSCGEYIAFLDSDDLWLPEKLAMQVEILDKNQKIGMVYGNQITVNEESNIEKLRYEPTKLKSGHIFIELLMRDFYCSTQTILIRSSVIDKIGPFDETFSNSLEDWEFTLRIAYNYQVACIQQPVIKRFENSNYSNEYTLTRCHNHKKILEKTFCQLKAPLTIQKKAWKAAWFSWGDQYLQAGHYFRGLICFSQAFIRGHRYAIPGALLCLLGPVGQLIYRRLLHSK